MNAAAIHWTSSGPDVGAPQAPFPTRILPAIILQRQQYVVSPDGQRFLLNSSLNQTNGSPIKLLFELEAESAVMC